MSKLLYQTDSYIQNFTATLMGIDETQHAVILDQTAFYPGGGGQPADSGSLRVGDTEYRVLKAKKDSDRVLHFLEGEQVLPAVGSLVAGQIDWERRYQLMRTHTALHVLCGVVFRNYGAQVTGGDMDPLKGRMDFEFETMQKELVQEIETAVNQAAARALPVRVAILRA